MELFQEKYSSLEKFKNELNLLVEERQQMEACIEEVIVELQHGGTPETALEIMRKYQRIEVVSSYLDEFPKKEDN